MCPRHITSVLFLVTLINVPILHWHKQINKQKTELTAAYENRKMESSAPRNNVACFSSANSRLSSHVWENHRRHTNRFSWSGRATQGTFRTLWHSLWNDLKTFLITKRDFYGRMFELWLWNQTAMYILRIKIGHKWTYEEKNEKSCDVLREIFTDISWMNHGRSSNKPRTKLPSERPKRAGQGEWEAPTWHWLLDRPIYIPVTQYANCAWTVRDYCAAFMQFTSDLCVNCVILTRYVHNICNKKLHIDEKSARHMWISHGKPKICICIKQKKL